MSIKHVYREILDVATELECLYGIDTTTWVVEAADMKAAGEYVSLVAIRDEMDAKLDEAHK